MQVGSKETLARAPLASHVVATDRLNCHMRIRNRKKTVIVVMIYNDTNMTHADKRDNSSQQIKAG